MSFSDLIENCNRKTMVVFSNAMIIAIKGGVAVRSFRGIFDQFADVTSPWESERQVIKPVLTADSSDLEGLGSGHVFDITRDGSRESKRYAFDGKPAPDGTGLTVVHLAEKK